MRQSSDRRWSIVFPYPHNLRSSDNLDPCPESKNTESLQATRLHSSEIAIIPLLFCVQTPRLCLPEPMRQTSEFATRFQIVHDLETCRSDDRCPKQGRGPFATLPILGSF